MVERILGIDPGSHRCGFAIVDFAGGRQHLVDHGCFDYAAGSQPAVRLMALEKDISELCMRHQPKLMAIESLFFNKNTTTAMRVSESRGVILLAAAKQGVAVIDCTPLQVKMAVTGYGRADKTQIKHMIGLQFQGTILHKLDDAVDAIGVALTGQSLAGYARLTQK